MDDLSQQEGFGGADSAGDDDDWDEGDESIDTTLEDGLDDLDEPDDEGWDDEGDE